MSINNEECLRLCSKGELGVLKEMLRDLDRTEIESIRDKFNASCLHYAARSGFVNILEYLIVEKNVSPFLVSEIGATCLHDAAVKGKLNVIEWVVNNTSLNASFKDSNGATLIHLAAKFDQLDIIEWILRTEGPKAAKQQTFNGATCVHFAAGTNSFRSLRRLLHAVPSAVNVQMMNGVTPVYLAAQEDNLSLVKFLIRMGANVFLRASDGMNVLHVACQNGNLDLVDLLYREYNANLNDKDYNGATPLHYACINGNPALVAYLLSNGARITIDKFGNTPLHDTAVGGYIECARLLIASECDTIARDNQNMTSADIAESYGHLDFAKELRKFERASVLKQKLAYENQKETTIEEQPPLKQQQEKDNSSPKTANNQSVTSPIFNSMAVVSTSTPSAIDKENQTPPPVDLNNTANSIMKTSGAHAKVVTSTGKNSNKIELNIHNSRPQLTAVSSIGGVGSNNSMATSASSSASGSGASTLRLFIKKQDFSVQVANSGASETVNVGRSQTVNLSSGAPRRYVQSPNVNTFGRSKKSLDLVVNEELAKDKLKMSQVSALEELDKCIAEFDRDGCYRFANNANNNNNNNNGNYSRNDLSTTNKSLTGVTDLSTSRVNNRDLSLSTFIDENNNGPNKISQIMESTGSSNQSARSCSGDAKNCSSIASISRDGDDLLLEQIGSPDLNNNNNSMRDANGRLSGPIKPSNIPPPPPLPLTTTPINENNFNGEYRNFMLKSVKNYETERLSKPENSNSQSYTKPGSIGSQSSTTSTEKKFTSYIDELQKNFKNGSTLLKRQQQQQQQQQGGQNNNNDELMERFNRRSTSNEKIIMRFDPPKTAANENPVPTRSASQIIRRISDIQPPMTTQQSNADTMPEWKRQLIEKRRSKMIRMMND